MYSSVNKGVHHLQRGKIKNTHPLPFLQFLPKWGLLHDENLRIVFNAQKS